MLFGESLDVGSNNRVDVKVQQQQQNADGSHENDSCEEARKHTGSHSDEWN